MRYASVCVLSYNRPQLLADTLKTLRLNAGAPFELIVHDDGSGDPSVINMLTQQLARGHISTLMLNPPGWNQGQGTALNRMFNTATGDPIIKVDQDLIFHLGWLQKVNEILDNNDSGFILGDPMIGLLGLLHYHYEPVDTDKTRIATWPGWEQHTHILGSAFAVRREAWRNLGPFQEHSTAFAEDWAFQRAITDSESFVCALPEHDLCENIGMGIGPSTVNTVSGVASIHQVPFTFGVDEDDHE